MRTLIYVIAAITLGIWSLFAWAVNALLGAAAGFAVANTWLLPVPPEWVYWAAEVFDGASGVGSVLVWIVWGLGAAVILILTLIALKLVGGRRPQADGPGAYPTDLDRVDVRREAPPRTPSVEEIVSRVSGKPRR